MEDLTETLSPLHVYLLGRFLVVAGETPVSTVKIPRVQSLIAYLLLHRNAPQDRSHLAFLFWPDSTEAQAHTNLRQLLYHLRQFLPDADQFLRISKQHLQWAPAQATFTLDVQDFELACARAEQTSDSVERRQLLEQAVQLYHGELLPGCYEEWIAPERDRLRQMFLRAAQRLSMLLEEERAYPAAIATAQALLRQDPLHEATYRQLMRLYALHGDRPAALRTYHTCAKVLERELGIGPGEMTQAAYTSLMQSESAPQARKEGVSDQRLEAPLQGRKAEWRQLQKAWNTVSNSSQRARPHLVLLSGEAGIGKTRLAQELELWVSRQGMHFAHARCYATLENLAYAPVTSWLRSDALQVALPTLDPTSLTEIARLLPEVLSAHPRLSAPAVMTEEWQRQIFFTALARAVLAAQQPLLLVLDDVQWCDQETLRWLQYLFHFASEARLLLVSTVRVGETVPTHPLSTFLASFQRDGLVTEIPLGSLTQAETTALAEQILNRSLNPGVGETLYAESEGNPFFVVEMAQASTPHTQESAPSERSRSLPLMASTTSALPPAVQAVLTTRLAQLSEPARTLAQLAAVIGREFSFSVLVHASGESEDAVVQAIDELWQRRLVRECDGGTIDAYDFSHDKLRQQIYSTLSPARRRLLHRRVAEALKAVYREDQDSVSGQLAAHYKQAGLLEQALPLYLRAGEVASQLYAHAEAQRAFERAVALLEAGPASSRVPWETTVQAYVALGDVQVEHGACEAARQTYERAQKRIPVEAQFWQARLCWKMGIAWICASTERHDPAYAQGCQAFEAAEQILTQLADPQDTAWRDEWIALHFARLWQGRGSVHDMAAAIAKVQPLVEQYGTQQQRKLLAEAVGIHNAMRDRYVIPTERVASWRATLAALGPTENEAQRALDLAVLGVGLLCAAQFDEAEQQLQQALHLGERTGSARVQNNCLTFLPFIFRRRGLVEEVRRLLARARELGVAESNRVLAGHAAWLAWRDGDLALAERYGRESLVEEHTQQIRPNPFLWTGRWPLIGIALTKEQMAPAIEHVRLLFDETQQPPPRPLDELLTTALHLWDSNAQAEAHALLEQARLLAEQLGYL